MSEEDLPCGPRGLGSKVMQEFQVQGTGGAKAWREGGIL